MIQVESLCDSRTNLFIVNSLTILHDAIPWNDSVGTAGGNTDSVICKGTLCIIFLNMKESVCFPSQERTLHQKNPHNEFPLLPFMTMCLDKWFTVLVTKLSFETLLDADMKF